jgi:hypothetical protein
MNGPYAEHVLDNPEVCSNCFSRIRVERVDPVRRGLSREYESHYERERRTTSIEYAPAESASDAKGVFCECGVEGHRERVWDESDVDRERFRAFTQQLLQTLAALGVTVKREETAGYALQARRDDAGVDEAFATAIDAGLVAAAASGASDTSPRERSA